MANTPAKTETKPDVKPDDKPDPAHDAEMADASENAEPIVKDSLGNVYDPYEQYISYEEKVLTTMVVKNPDTGVEEPVPVATVKRHLVPLSKWAAYERAHGWA